MELKERQVRAIFRNWLMFECLLVKAQLMVWAKEWWSGARRGKVAVAFAVPVGKSM